MTELQGPPATRDPEISSLVRSVRRLAIAVWCLTGLLAISYIVPWAIYLLRLRSTTSHVISTSSPAVAVSPATIPAFDNDFHARPPEEKIKRATVILLTRLTRGSGMHKEVISEIVKRSPNVRFYYKIGDEFPMLSHMPTADCGDCEGQGQVVFLIGNPAEMASSYSFEHDRIQGMGGLSLVDLRQLAQKSEQGIH